MTTRKDKFAVKGMLTKTPTKKLANPYKTANPNPRRLNLTFTHPQVARDIRAAAKAEGNSTPSQYIERWIGMVIRDELVQPPDIKEYVDMKFPGEPTPQTLAEYRLSRLLEMSLGVRHPAMADLATLILQARPSRETTVSFDMEKLSEEQKKRIVELVNREKEAMITGFTTKDVIGTINMMDKGTDLPAETGWKGVDLRVDPGVRHSTLDVIGGARGTGIATGKANVEHGSHPAYGSNDQPRREETINAMDTTRPVSGGVVPDTKVEEVKSNVRKLKEANHDPVRTLMGSLASIVRTQNGNKYPDITALLEQAFAYVIDGEVPGQQIRIVSPLQSIAKPVEYEEPAREDGDDTPMTLLQEVQQAFTRNDDLPNDLLPRIDKILEGKYTVIESDELNSLYGKALIRDELWAVVKTERPDLAQGMHAITSIVRDALRGTLMGTPRTERIAPDASLEARFHRALVRMGKLTRSSQGYVMGAYREAAIEHTQSLMAENKSKPADDTVYRHHTTGNTYRKLGEGRIQSNVPLDDMAYVVIYEGKDGKLWARPVVEWNTKFKPVGHVTPAGVTTVPPGGTPTHPEVVAAVEGAEAAWTPTENSGAVTERVAPTTPQTHQLKCYPEPFEQVLLNAKKMEFRQDDRDFRVGDRLLLCEWNPETETYTGRNIERFVTHIQTGFGVPTGYVAMSIMDAKSMRDRAEPNHRKYLGELLAVIHRDGGHYQTKHGTEKAVLDAIGAINTMRTLIEGKRLKPFSQMWEAFSKKRGMIYGRDAREQVRVGYDMVEEAIQEAFWTTPVYQPTTVSERVVFRHLGFIIATADEEEFMKWGDSGPEWTKDREEAIRFARRDDAEAVAAESEKAWKIFPHGDSSELRQGIGEKLSDVLQQMDEGNTMDWPNAANIDIVLDAIMPVVIGELAP
jgi:hypothetical protein